MNYTYPFQVLSSQTVREQKLQMHYSLRLIVQPCVFLSAQVD
jgi:hypothetical protein